MPDATLIASYQAYTSHVGRICFGDHGLAFVANMQLPFQHHVDFVVVQGPREECVLPLHKTGGHAAAVVSGHKISQGTAG